MVISAAAEQGEGRRLGDIRDPLTDLAEFLESEGVSFKLFRKTGILDFYQDFVILSTLEVKAIAQRRKSAPKRGFWERFIRETPYKMVSLKKIPDFFHGSLGIVGCP